MTGEQVLRCTLIQQTHPFSCEKLAFHLADSQSFRTFCRLPYGFTPRKSALQENISKIQDTSWQQINRVLIGWANQKGLEKGAQDPSGCHRSGKRHPQSDGQPAT